MHEEARDFYVTDVKSGYQRVWRAGVLGRRGAGAWSTDPKSWVGVKLWVTVDIKYSMYVSLFCVTVTKYTTEFKQGNNYLDSQFEKSPPVVEEEKEDSSSPPGGQEAQKGEYRKERRGIQEPVGSG